MTEVKDNHNTVTDVTQEDGEESHYNTTETTGNLVDLQEDLEDWFQEPPGGVQQLVEHSRLQQCTQLEEMNLQLENEDLMLAHLVRTRGYPNRYGARIPIKSNWNLQKLQQQLQDYHDKEIVDWLRYGWPSGRLPTMEPPAKTYKNHKGATDYPEALQKYITKEAEKGAVMGPFNIIPFTRNVGISPISTRPKKQSGDRRVIIDLSFPPGQGVNDGMIKDNYLGEMIKLTFPKVDDLALRIYTLGKEARMFKVDLSRYFRQLPLDPGDYSLVGYIIDGQLYFDKMLPMGMRTAPYIAQRVSNALRYIHQQLKFFLLNYVDDFVGAEHKDTIWRAFEHFTRLLEELKVDTSPEKMVPPTTRLEFLGVTLDSQTMTMEIPPEKIEETQKELHTWLYKSQATKKELQSLLGRLQFMSKCIRQGRIFVSRLLNWLRNWGTHSRRPIPGEARKDIAWWGRFLSTYNGVSLIWLHTEPRLDHVMATDASKAGFGGLSGHKYFRGRFPSQWRDKNIAELEIRAVVVALKIWGTELQGLYFWIHMDNEAVATVINTGAAREESLQEALREIALLAAQNQFIIKAKHISGVSNRIPDWLSRWGDSESKRKFNQYAKDKGLLRCKLPDDRLGYTNVW